MRFGKRNRGRLIPPLREGEASAKPSLGPVARDERNALLYGVEDDFHMEDQDAPSRPVESSSGGDPTQRMLTALGRFHRFVDKGQSGAADANWSDECMNQLGVAIEVSFEQNWANLVEALTDTARVLQSYEDADAAAKAIPFLNDGYEILCLMVGDIIVDNTRSDVMDRWRARYGRAVQELQVAGITLVQDEDDEDAPEEQADVSADSNVIPFELPPTRATTPVADESKAAPSLDTYLPFLRAQDEDEEELVGTAPTANEPVEPPAFEVEEPVFETVSQVPANEISAESAEAEPFEFELPAPPAAKPAPASEYSALDKALEGLLQMDPLAETMELPASHAAAEIAPPEAPAFEEALPADEAEPQPEFIEEPEEESVFAPALSPVVAPVAAPVDHHGNDPVTLALLDSFSEDLAAIEQSPELNTGARWDALREKAASLAACAKDNGLAAAEAICAAMGELCLAASRRRAGGIEGFVDTAYLFCEAYIQADRNPDSAVVANWHRESAALLKAWTAGPPAGDPTDHLLETARDAMARGDLSGAKALALQAVAQMAKGEAARAETRVQDAELRLKQNSEAIEQARQAVTRAEQAVLIAEGRVSEGEQALLEAQSLAQSAEQQSVEAAQRVADTDEEIRRLQERRERELEQARQADEALQQARETEAGSGEELDALRRSEEGARAQLEDARQTVKDHQRRRTEIETALLNSRETLTRHRSSLSDIERAVEQTKDSQDVPDQDSSGLLFD